MNIPAVAFENIENFWLATGLEETFPVLLL